MKLYHIFSDTLESSICRYVAYYWNLNFSWSNFAVSVKCQVCGWFVSIVLHQQHS